MTPEAVRWLLMVLVFPLWIAAGLADWACHRRSGIERSSGLPENLFHWVLFAELGMAALAVALLEVNAAVLLVVAGAFVAHELTTYVELRYAVPRRPVGPVEQMVHSFQELLPLVMLALLAVAAWDQVTALVVAGPADFSLRLKEQPWPPASLLGLALAVLACNV
ncbi:MAG: diguanylate cyclase, partial [Comamonadaceae bacterium]